MAKVTVKLNTSGIKELLKSKEMLNICEEYANNALGRLGNGYKVTSMTGRNRVNAEISAETNKAKRDNAKNNTILKALKG